MNTLLEGFYMPLRVILLEIMHTLLLIAWSYAFLIPISFLVSLGYGLLASSADLAAMLTDPTNAAVGLSILLIWKGPYFAAAYAGAYESMCEDLKARQQRAQELRQQYPPHS